MVNRCLVLIAFLRFTPLLYGDVLENSSPLGISFYYQGLQFGKLGNFLDAKSCYTKFVAYCEYNGQDCTPHALDKSENFLTNPLLAKKTFPKKNNEFEISKLVVNISTVTPKQLQKSIVKKEKLVMKQEYSVNQKPHSFSQLALEAEKAQKQGQYERALHLYRLAEKSGGNRPLYSAQIEELLALME